MDSPNSLDLFISVGEASGDLYGAKLAESLLKKDPSLKIGGSLGPKMRKLPIHEFFRMEDLCVMGFIDVLLSLPKIILRFYRTRKKILELEPKTVIFIDYPGFHLKLEKSLRKKGFKGKLVHFICPTVWAWGKKRIKTMEENLDLLLTIFPFEPKCFAHTKLPVRYIGHPLKEIIDNYSYKHFIDGKIIALFPGSRKKEIKRNLPLQLKVAKRLQALDPTLQIAVSKVQVPGTLYVEDTYELMRSSFLALATSGTVTLELALHKVPTVVTYATTKLDTFLAQKIFGIDLPYYCIVNIILEKMAFCELIGPTLTEEALFEAANRLLIDAEARKETLHCCEQVAKALPPADFSLDL
jgi:lipid-A-disaccharide synthase